MKIGKFELPQSIMGGNIAIVLNPPMGFVAKQLIGQLVAT